MTMPEQSPAQRSAEALNAEIRALWVDGALPVESRDEYARLVVAWAEATRGGQELAA
ncbi:hypothetical protein PUR59_00925 [Streptomyces sp. SP18ES09]|uniref:hypothetical protein n=1 Tax=Streptomyces sp. SP18ES09 TaxID=3002532 RepID=UPI002E7A9432|nr:hypothetical protein [Streptomyces sp. SP18ES09]MEE1813604.1 hypothetical protein [Streptomyces sp. SP18ES09]